MPLLLPVELLQLGVFGLGGTSMFPMEKVVSPMLQASPNVPDLFPRIAGFPALAAHCRSQSPRPLTRAALGIVTVGVFRVTPAGRFPIMTMSVGSCTGMVPVVAFTPSPVRHSPQATVLVEPSTMSRRPIAVPAELNGPLGRPPAVFAGPDREPV